MLKPILDQLISHNQSAFVPSRLITDNVIVGFECLHKLNSIKSKNGFAVLKLDMSKAYDRVEWTFIDQVMRQLGFSDNWIGLIMNCISTTSFSILIYSELKGKIKPQMGLRQGCPLSPYLFLLYGEALSSLIHSAESSQSLHGLKANARSL